MLGPYYAVQQDLQTKALIVHDRTLLPADLQVEQGRSFRIEYREGVSKVEASRAPSSAGAMSDQANRITCPADNAWMR